MKSILTTLFIIIFEIASFSQQKNTTIKPTNVNNKQAIINFIEKLKKDEDLKNAAWSVTVIDCNSKKTIINYNSQINLIPASILKLVTTGVGMIELGGNYKFTTLLVYDGNISSDSLLNGNLYIIGGGDPTLGSTQFEKTNPDSLFSYFTKEISKAGIRSINGKIIADISLFDNENINDTWEWGDIGNYYGGGTSALNYCENTFTITIKPGDSINKKGSVDIPNPSLFESDTIRNMVITSSQKTKTSINIYSSPIIPEHWIKGNIAISHDSIVGKGSILNPPLVFLKNFDVYLNKNGINTLNLLEIKTDSTQISFNDTICSWFSPDYYKIAENINRFSNNVFAESVFKTIAYKKLKTKLISYQIASDEVIKTLDRRKIETKSIAITDGSGLSRHNTVSGEFMCNYLLLLYNSFPNFDKLLPSPGEKGTLAGFMYKYPQNRKKVRLKSGSMTGVLNYAGYIQNKKGNTLCITVMTNNFSCKVSKIRPKIEQLINLVVDSE